MTSVYVKALWERRKSLLGWVSALAALILLESALALATTLGVLALAVVDSTGLGSAVFGLDVPLSAAAAGALAMLLLGAEFRVLARLAGAFTGRRGLVIAVPAAAALGAYVLYVGGALLDELASWRSWSPFDQALGAGPLAPAVPASVVLLVIVPAVLLQAVVPVWARRDL